MSIQDTYFNMKYCIMIMRGVSCEVNPYLTTSKSLTGSFDYLDLHVPRMYGTYVCIAEHYIVLATRTSQPAL